MIVLASTSDLVRVITGSAVTTDVHATWVDVDITTGDVTPGRTNTLLTTATTTTVVAAGASADIRRALKTLTIRNRHASSSNDVTAIHSDGTNIPELIKVTLSAGDALHYDGPRGWTVRDLLGRIKRRSDFLVPATSTDMNTVILGSDQANSNAGANTMEDVTGLSFAVTTGLTYWFCAMIAYTSAATSTGSRWSINGPAITTLIYKSEYSLTTTTRTINEGLSAYDSPAASNATSAATGSNIAWIEGFLTPSADGTLIVRHASEVSASAITAKAGSILQYQQVL